MKHWFNSFILFFAFCPQSLARATSIVLPVITKEELGIGTPGDYLMEDGLVDAKSIEVGTGKSLGKSGGLDSAVRDRWALPWVANGQPGGVSQVRGWGRSVENTEVQTLGVPLNPPQGGGADLSVFPQFLWSRAQYQLGPALGVMDARGTAGSFVLTPWSAAALAREGDRPSAEVALSLGTSQQLSVAASRPRAWSIIVGETFGDLKGQSLGVSARRSVESDSVLALHVLATDVDAKTTGYSGAGSVAQQSTQRVLPVLQWDRDFKSWGIFKSSVFADVSLLRYVDSDLAIETVDRSRQFGIESAWGWGAWRTGGGLRKVFYTPSGRTEQSEWVGKIQAARLLSWGSWGVEPTLRWVGVSRYGVLPEFSLGARNELDWGSFYLRFSENRSFPSLLNRTYDLPPSGSFLGFEGNPALLPERTWSGLVGLSRNAGIFRPSIEAFGQWIQQAQLRVNRAGMSSTVLNSGDAWVGTLRWSGAVARDVWRLRGSGALSASRVVSTGESYPLLPARMGVFALERTGWVTGAIVLRTQGVMRDGLGQILPASWQVNLQAAWQSGESFSAVVRIDNLFGQEVYWTAGLPSVGRSVSANLSARL